MQGYEEFKTATLKKLKSQIIPKGIKVSDQNLVVLNGEVDKKPTFFYFSNSRNHYRATVRVRRPSGIFDYVPVVFSEVLGQSDMTKGTRIQVIGQLSSYNRHDDREDVFHLDMYVYATYIHVFDGHNKWQWRNNLFFEGLIAPKHLRKTSTGISIFEFFASQKMTYRKVAYFPCIAWNKLAHVASKFPYHTSVGVFGTFHSRDYWKEIEGMRETHTTHEISAINVFTR